MHVRDLGPSRGKFETDDLTKLVKSQMIELAYMTTCCVRLAKTNLAKGLTKLQTQEKKCI